MKRKEIVLHGTRTGAPIESFLYRIMLRLYLFLADIVPERKISSRWDEFGELSWTYYSSWLTDYYTCADLVRCRVKLPFITFTLYDV